MDVSLNAQLSWPRSAPHGRKIACPECGVSGYLGGKWVRKHAAHVTCTCGKVVSLAGLPSHMAAMARHGKPCPS